MFKDQHDTTKTQQVRTVVWEKLVIRNIDEKKFRGKKFSS